MNEMNEMNEVNESESDLIDLLSADYDYEIDSKPPEEGGTTLCGKLGRKHKMKRYGPMHTGCIYPGCDACR